MVVALLLSLVAALLTQQPAAAALPAQEPVSPAASTLDFEFFRTKVQPILLAKREGHTRCVSCHSKGTPMRLQALSKAGDPLALRIVGPDGRAFCDLSELDPEAQAEAATRLRGRCDYLLLPAGGRTAPAQEFLARARPGELIVSTAAARLARGIPPGVVRRTDQEGAIELPL